MTGLRHGTPSNPPLVPSLFLKQRSVRTFAPNTDKPEISGEVLSDQLRKAIRQSKLPLVVATVVLVDSKEA